MSSQQAYLIFSQTTLGLIPKVEELEEVTRSYYFLHNVEILVIVKEVVDVRDVRMHD